MRIKQWPLGPHSQAVLVAVGSPDAQGRGQQWRTHAYFQKEDGETFDLRLSWGLLPKLRPGSVFLNGYLTGHAVAREELEVMLKAPPKLVSWREATAGEAGWARMEALQDELCLQYKVEGETLVVPCIQVLRAFHAQTRLISHAILRPAVLSELASGELNGDEAKLYIARHVPQGVATKVFTNYLARLIFEPSWLDSFSDVFHRRFAVTEQAGIDKTERIPLECFPPRNDWARWRVVGQYLSSGAFLVDDWLSTQSSNHPPYRRLMVFHSKKGPAPKRDGSLAAVDGDSEDEKEKRKRGEQDDPNSVSRPFLVRQRAIEHLDSNPARVFDVFPARKPDGSGDPRGGGDKGGAGVPPRQERQVSTDEERRSGGTTSAEFHGLPGRDTLPIHFSIFIEAFRTVMEHRDGWKMEFSVEALSEYLPDCQPVDRLVLFGRVTTPQTIGYIVELEPLQGQTSYTLTVVRRQSPEAATTKEVGMRLPKWLTASGRSHVPELLKGDEDYVVTLSTHRNLGAGNWTTRILDKIDPPETRPSWMRGVAK